MLIATRFERAVDLAQAAGVSESQLSQWVRGIRNINEKSARKIERAARMPERWLDSLTAEEAPAPTYAAGPYPVLSSIRAGHFDDAKDPYPPGVADEWIAGTRDAGPRGYWLRVEGDSMTAPSGRSFPAGCLVLVDPRRRSPVHGDIVVARQEGEDRVTLKQFVDEDGRRWLRPLNQQYPAIIDRFLVLGTVIAKLEQ